MLAEIFLVRLQNLLRTNALNESTSGRRDPRFVPMPMPRPQNDR